MQRRPEIFGVLRKADTSGSHRQRGTEGQLKDKQECEPSTDTRTVHRAQISNRSSRVRQRSTDAALVALEQRAEGLRAEVARRDQEQQALAQRFHAFVADQAKEQAAAESALKRLLGGRYDTLRMQALAQDATVIER